MKILITKKDYDHKRYINNRNKIIARSLKYQKEHYPDVRKRQKKYSNSAKGHFKVLKQRCKKKHCLLEITQEQFLNWYNNTKRKCFYCGIKEIDIRKAKYEFTMGRIISRLTIDRKDSNKGYSLNNIVLACIFCNIAKSNIFTVKEMKEIGRKYIKNKWIKLCQKQAL